MRRSVSIISILIVVFSFAITAFSFEIDGINDGTEWEDAQSVLLFSGEESNSKVKFGALMWAVEDSSLYLCFNFIEPEFTPENTNIGVVFSVDDSESYTVTVGEPIFFDSEKYRVEGEISVNIAKGATCEVRVGFKHGIPDEINGKVRFIDSEGSYSNIYDFCIENKTQNYYEDSYVIEYKETYKTTKNTTVKETTNKAEKTTKAKTTKASKTTDKSDDKKFNLLDFLNQDETTKKETTKSTTKNKTDKTTNKSKKSYATSTVTAENDVSENTEASGSIAATDVSQNSNAIQTPIATTEGKKYQLITMIACGAALLTVVILGAAGANRKAEKSARRSDEKSKNEPENKG